MASRRQDVPDSLIEQAITWSVAMRSGTAGTEVKQACDAWRATTLEHERAWRCIQQLEAPFASVLAVGAAAPAIAGAGRRVLEYTALQPHGLSRRRALRAVCVTTAAGALGYAGYARLAPRGDYATAAAQRRTVVLADDTRLELDAASAVDVRYNAQARTILLRKGQILVHTGHRSFDGGALSPFWVVTQQGRMQALGTRFLVRLDGSSTVVQVDEGTVGVYGPGARVPTLLSPGQAQRLYDDGRVSAMPGQPDASAWTDGSVVAQSMRLAELIDRLRPYRRGWLLCAPSIADLRVSGVFGLDDTDLALSALARSLPVRIERLTDYWIRVIPA